MAERIPKWSVILAVFGVSIIVLVLALLGWTGYTRGFTGQLVDANGKSLQGAFVLFIYRNDSLNPGGPIEHVFASGILETDQNGQFHIPARFDFFIPLFQTSLQPWVEAAYSPTTHSCVSAGSFLENFDDSEMDVHEVTLTDSSNDLQARAIALESFVDSLDERIVVEKWIPHLKAPPGVSERLVSALRSEYDFLQPRLFPESAFNPSYVDASNILSSPLFLPRIKFHSVRERIETYANEMKKEHQEK